MAAPKKSRQELKMSGENDLRFQNEVRVYVYEHFVSQCRAPTIAEVADALAVSTECVHVAFESLADRHVLVLHPDTREVWMAMPFSAVHTSFRVLVGDSAWWANCAWDALGIPAMLRRDAQIEAQCANSGISLNIDVRAGALSADATGVIHFAVPAASWWDDIGYT
jgi:hypothetical protein